MRPVISVLMPVYNVGPYVKDAVQSILNQSFRDFEIIIVDDASTDDTEQKINELRDKRILYLRSSQNQGIVEALNSGLEIARGEFFARMDGDDLSHPERFKKQIEFLERNSTISVCGTWLEKFGAVNRLVKAIEHPKELKFALGLNTFLPHATMLARATIIRDNKIRYTAEHIYAEDYSLFTKLSRFAEMASIPEVLYSYRIHNENISVSRAAIVKANAAKVRFEYLRQNLGQVFSEDVLRNAADAWAADDNTLDKERLQQLLAVYTYWYEQVIGDDHIPQSSVFREVVDSYFLHLLRYKCKKSGWALAHHFKKSVYRISLQESLKSVAHALLKK